MQGMSVGALGLLLLLNLSPYGPPQVSEGTFWTYNMYGQVWTMRVVEVSADEAGTALDMEVSVNGHTLRLRGTLSQDRRSLSLENAGPGGKEKLSVEMPELKPGARLEPPGEMSATVIHVQPLPMSTPAGDFPEAIEVSLAVEGESEGTMWLAPGVGLLAVGSDGMTMMELVDYGPRSAPTPPGSDLAPPKDIAPITARTGIPSAPALLALDENTFVVADPAARTLTVFVLVRSAAGRWRLETKAVAPYGPVTQ
jgi:hypothetical protein